MSDCAVLLPQVDPKALGKCLTQRSFQTAREHVTKSLTSAQAVDGRDAFVKVKCVTLILKAGPRI